MLVFVDRSLGKHGRTALEQRYCSVSSICDTKCDRASSSLRAYGGRQNGAYCRNSSWVVCDTDSNHVAAGPRQPVTLVPCPAYFGFAYDDHPPLSARCCEQFGHVTGLRPG